MRKSLLLGTFAVLASAPVVSAVSAEPSPIFGKASVQITTVAENKKVIGKGQYGELYAYYGNYYANQAAVYGSLGQYYGYLANGEGTNFYYQAYLDAGYAVTYYNYAYTYEKAGL
jgi:hypothetical protein